MELSKVLCYVDIASGTICTLPDYCVDWVEKPFDEGHPYPYVVYLKEGKSVQTKDCVWVVVGEHGSFHPGQVVEVTCK